MAKYSSPSESPDRHVRDACCACCIWLVVIGIGAMTKEANAAPPLADNELPASGDLRTGHASGLRILLADAGDRSLDLTGCVVLYPDIGEPYRTVFASIVSGIQSAASSGVAAYAVSDDTDMSALAGRLRRQGTRAVIALGRNGVNAALAMDLNVPVVAGGIITVPDAKGVTLSGISLSPDPELLFEHLKGMLPSIRRVAVIYDPQNSGWLMGSAREAARAQGLELEVHEAHDLAGAARLYAQVLESMEGRHTALWLPQDSTTVDESVILPLVLRESWSRNIPVFSSSLLHVKKGVLFSLFPDNAELGLALGKVAHAQLTGGGKSRMVPLRAVLTAVNIRTANHIGLNFDYQQIKHFDLTFPQQ